MAPVTNKRRANRLRWLVRVLKRKETKAVVKKMTKKTELEWDRRGRKWP